MRLSVPFGCELYPVVRDSLVEISILIPFGLGMADQDDHLAAVSNSNPEIHRYNRDSRVACPWLILSSTR